MYFDELFGFAPISRHVFPRPGRRYLADPAAEPEEGIALASPVGVPAPLMTPARSPMSGRTVSSRDGESAGE
jgi:hypothetical protein